MEKDYIKQDDLDIMLDEYSKHIPPDFNNKVDMNNIKITTHFVRHAESSSNYARGDISDNHVKQPIIGYNKLHEEHTQQEKTLYDNLHDKYQDILDMPKNITSAIKSASYYHPILTYIGMQHGILLGRDFVRKNEHNYDVIFVSPTFRAIFTALLAMRGSDKVIYVVPYINEVSNMAKYVTGDFQNMPVPSNILKNCVLFFKDWMEHNWISEFDDIELMEMLIEIKKLFVGNDEVLMYINPILNNKFYKVKQNIINNLKMLVETLKTTNYDTTLLENFLNVKFIRGPKVDFSIYEHFESRDKKTLSCPSFDKLYNVVIPKAIQMNIIIKQNEIKILCVTHGTFIKGEIKRLYGINIDHPMNTEIIEEIRLVHNVKHVVNVGIYKPIKIRSNYENFEILNKDICRTEGLKGILNIAIWNNNDHGIIPNVAMTNGCKIYDPEYYADNNVKFYFQNRDKYQLVRSSTMIYEENYYTKYVKYKNKYLKSKNGIHRE